MVIRGIGGIRIGAGDALSVSVIEIGLGSTVLMLGRPVVTDGADIIGNIPVYGALVVAEDPVLIGAY